MTARAAPQLLDRDTEIGALSSNVKVVIKRIILPLAVVLAFESLFLIFSDRPGANAFALMSLGTCIALGVWGRCGSRPSTAAIVMIIQNLVIYGVPIAVGHEVIVSYPPDFVLSAGLEVLVFNVIMIVAWKAGMMIFRPAPAVSYRAPRIQQDRNPGVGQKSVPS